MRRLPVLRFLSLVAFFLIGQPPAAHAQQGVQTVHAFQVPASHPLGALVQAPDGQLYGTTSAGGAARTIFRLPHAGGPAVTVHTFTYGRYPDSSLILGLDGALYGTTFGGGIEDAGTVFRFDPATS